MRQHNLPEDRTSLIGREHDRAQVVGLLESKRLVSLVGPGGVGKTRLALSAARAAVRDCRDGVWLVELVSLADPGLLPQGIAAAVGVTLPSDDAPRDALVSVLASRQLVLVLDNCEHLVQDCAELADALLQSCPRLRILVTSREPLGVPGEVIWPVPPLPTPTESTLDHLLDADAVRLFVERARAVQPDFALTPANAPAVAQICQRLDGLPLALELAAARIPVLSPAQIAARLDDRFQVLVGGSRTTPPRQRTLEAAVDWSYTLLEPRDERLFDQLSVFAGDFSLAATDAVCNQGAGSQLDGLARLVAQSLVVAGAEVDGERRYRLLETLRAYGRDRLRARGEEQQVQGRLAAWVQARAEEASIAFRGPDQARWFRWAEREHDNVRGVLTWAVAIGVAEVAIGITGALWWSWLLHGRWPEAQHWLDLALSMPGAEAHTARRARALHGAATTAAFCGEYHLARSQLDECLLIAGELEDEPLRLEAMAAGVLLEQFQGNLEGAQVQVQAMVELSERLDRPWYRARAAEFRAAAAIRRGDLSAAAAELEAAIKLARAAGDLWNMSMLLTQLGDVERMRGTHPRAAPLYEESIRISEVLGLRRDPSRIHNLAYVALAEGQTRGAEARFREAHDGFRRIGDRRGVAECLMGIGCVRAAARRPTEAARLFGAGEAALEALGSTVWPSNRADLQRWTRVAGAALGAERWASEREIGARLGEDAVLKENSDAATPSVRRPVASPVFELTRREREVAELAAQGLSNRRIAELLVITEKTAANHLQRALDKLDIHSRSQLAARATELGLVGSN